MEVAILVTNYNHNNYIKDCIKSIQKQTFFNFKAFIIDDNSSDNSIETIKEIIVDDERFDLVINNINLGKSKSLNRLLHKFNVHKFDFVAFLDSDDVWEKTKLEMQVNFLMNNDTDVCYSEGKLLFEKSYHKESWGLNQQKQYFSDIHRVPKIREGDLFQEFLEGNFVFYSSLMLKGEIFKKHEFNNLIRRSMDWLFLIEISKNHKFGYIKDALAQYRIHSNNLQAQVNRTHEVILPRLFVVQNYKNLMSRKKVANHYYALSRSVLDLNQRQKYLDFTSYYINAILHYPKPKKIIKLPINFIKSIFN